MLNSNIPIYLASKSPRRKKLLNQLGLKFKSFDVDLNEIFIKNESPIKTVKRLSLEKLLAAEKIKNNGIIITADTIVVLNNEIIGKPKNEKDAKNILKKLSDNKHFVYTGFAVKNCFTKKLVVRYEKTEVTFRNLTSIEIDEYVKTGSPMDKAGAYGIQDDFGAVFVSKINGCYYNVVGLPLSKLYSAINEVIWLKNSISKNIFISIFVTILIYLALSLFVDFESVIHALTSFKWQYSAFILSLIFFTFLLKFIKWQYYLRFINIEIKIYESFIIFMSALALSFSPGKMGDFVKSYMMKELKGISTKKTVPIIFAERMTEIFSLIILVILGLQYVNEGIFIPILTFLVLALLLILILNQRTIDILLRIFGKIKYIQKYIEPINISINNSKELFRPKPFILMMLLSISIWIIESFAFYLILVSFDLNIAVLWSFFTYLFSMFIGSISFLPAGLGITDGSITFLLSNNGISKDISIGTALLIRISTLWFPLIFGAFYMLKYNRILKLKEQN